MGFGCLLLLLMNKRCFARVAGSLKRKKRGRAVDGPRASRANGRLGARSPAPLGRGSVLDLLRTERSPALKNVALRNAEWRVERKLN
jgi:hypothetical protein